MCRFTRDGIPELGEYLESVDGIMRKEDGPIRHKENGAVRFRCPCRESNPVPLGNCERRGVPCTGRGAPGGPDAPLFSYSSLGIVGCVFRSGRHRLPAAACHAMATPFQSSVADSTLVSEQ